jgi:putative aminopeptidase FrvX
MILDERTEFADAQTVTATAISDVIDLGATPTLRSLGAGEPLYLVVSVDEAATAAGAATVTFSLESDSTADLATSATVHAATAAIGKAALTLGSTVAVIPLPVAATYERYLGVRFTVATGPLTAGKFSAFLTPNPAIATIYPDAVN